MSEEFNFSRRFLNKESEDCAKRHSIVSTTSSTSSTSIPIPPFYHRDSLERYNLRPRINHQVVKSKKTSTTYKTNITSTQPSTSGLPRYNLSSSSTSTSTNDSINSTLSLQNESQEFLRISSEEEDSELKDAGDRTENVSENHDQKESHSQSQYQSQGFNTGFNGQEKSSESSENFDDLTYLHEQECDSEDEMVPIFSTPHPNYKVQNRKILVKNKLHNPIIINKSSSSSLPCDTSFELNQIKMRMDNTDANRRRFVEVKNELLRKEQTICGSFVPIFAFALFFLSILIIFVFFFGEKKDFSTCDIDSCSCTRQKNPFFKLTY